MTTNDKIEVIFYNDFRRTTVKVKQVNPVIVVDEQGNEYFYKDHVLYDEEEDVKRRRIRSRRLITMTLMTRIDMMFDYKDIEDLKKIYDYITGTEFITDGYSDEEVETYLTDKINESMEDMDYDQLAELYNFVARM